MYDFHFTQNKNQITTVLYEDGCTEQGYSHLGCLGFPTQKLGHNLAICCVGARLNFELMSAV